MGRCVLYLTHNWCLIYEKIQREKNVTCKSLGWEETHMDMNMGKTCMQTPHRKASLASMEFKLFLL